MTNKTLELNPAHPLASELSSLRLAVSRFQDEAYTTSVKLQRQSLESANAHDRASYLERENEVLRTELAILRAYPHPDASPQAHPAVAQVQQLTLSLRRLSDKLSLTEDTLLERTTQLSHMTAEVGKAKLTAEAAYELAARTRGREETGKLRELELEQKVRAAEEAVKMSDLVVNEYADLVRSLQADEPHERLVDGLAKGKLGLQRLLNEFNGEIVRLQKELLETQGALTAAESQHDSEKKHVEQCRVELAQAQFELQQLKTDDNVAAKMVSRYMKFSQKSTDTLSEALSALKTRHSATTSTLSSQLLSLRSQLRASSTQTETLRHALDELGGELAKEAFGRRREVALRIRMVNREEKLRGALERWVIKAEEAQARMGGNVEVDAVDFGKIVTAARALLEGALGGEDGEVGRVVVVEAAVRELTMELEEEMRRRLELERIVALVKAEEAVTVDRIAVGDEQCLKKPEQPLGAHPVTLPVQNDAFDSTNALVTAPAPETPLSAAGEADSLKKSAVDDSVPLAKSITANVRESPSDPLTMSPSTFDIVNDEGSLPNDSIASSIPNGTSPHGSEDLSSIASSADGLNDAEVSTCIVVEPTVDVAPPEVSSNRTKHQQDLVSTEGTGEATFEEGSSINEIPVHPEFLINSAFESVISSGVVENSKPDSSVSQEQILNGVVLTGSTVHDDADPDSTAKPEHTPPRASTLPVGSEPSDPSSVSDALSSSTTNLSPKPLNLSLDTQSSPHPLLIDLAKTKHRYDTLQRSLRDCHLALESLSASLQSPVTGHVPAEALRTAAQRLNDYTEDARVELEIRIADEALIGRGFEMMLCVPGALDTLSLHEGQEQEQDPDAMTHLDVEKQVVGFINGTDPSVNKAIRSLSRKLEDIEHDIAILKRAVHDASDSDDSLLSPPTSVRTTNTKEGGGWTSWIRSTPTSPSLSPSPSPSSPLPTSTSNLGPTPTFGSVMSSPRLRHSPSLDFPGGMKRGTGVDPLASLGLRVPMPSYIQHQAPPAVQPRSRTLSTMYMLGIGAKNVSGSRSGRVNGFLGGSASPRNGKGASSALQDRDESEEDEGSGESDVE